MLKSSSPRNCKMTFIVGRGFAECQILKKWKWTYLLNWVEYFDKRLCKHWYWQDLAQEIANWHFLSVQALPSSKFLKRENGICTLILTRCSQWDCQVTFGIGRCFAEVQILQKVKLALSLEPLGKYFQNSILKMKLGWMEKWVVEG